MRVTVRVSTQPGAVGPNAHGRSARAFSLIDVLVSMAVITVLIGLMLPALTAIRETTRKVVCSSNIRQIGISTFTYAEDFKGALPHSGFYAKSVSTGEVFHPQELMMARIAPPVNATTKWDGLGLLFSNSYCAAPQVFYCPSHRSMHRYETYQQGWAGGAVNIYTNFQYRGGNSAGQNNLYKMPDRIALIADGMASMFDFNHSVGGNVVANDLSVAWFDDSSRGQGLPTAYDDPAGKEKLQEAWSEIDRTLFK